MIMFNVNDIVDWKFQTALEDAIVVNINGFMIADSNCGSTCLPDIVKHERYFAYW